RPHLRSEAGAGRGRGRARPPPRRPAAAVEPGPARPSRRGRGLRARQPGVHRQGVAALHRQGRPRAAVQRDRDPRATPAALRSDLADRAQAMRGQATPASLPWLNPARVAALEAALAARILVIDGAMGTMIQRHELQEADYRGLRFADAAHDQRGNNDLLTLVRPDIIGGIHQAYLDAGADLVETNTFNSTRISLADYGLPELVRELNREGATLARAACHAAEARTPDRPRCAVGVLGPASRTASLSPDVNRPGFRAVSFDELAEAYREAADGLIEGGADILMVETIFDTLNAKAALFAID